MESRGVELTDVLGLHYFLSDKFKIWQFVSYMFMHGSFMHIFFNMFAVFMFGAAIESVWGPKKFLTYYILTGLGAAVAHYAIVYYQMQPAIAFLNDYIDAPSMTKLQGLINSDAFTNFSSREMLEHYNSFTASFNELANTDQAAAMQLSVDFVKEFKADVYNAPVVVGASGAVFGLLLAYGMTYPNNIIYIYFAIPLKAKYFVILYGLIELFSGVANVPGDNVAHFAHLGGLITGLIIIQYWKKNNRKRQNDYFN
ncbi:MAG: rhomboid family intramembrane serine protease [Bacteroidia bacterium]|nr:rhomboid family intramembrane serine protease [Bacteroidota bacterium]MBK7430101.1 rhomboid family intramembrane serine protease [Bacteroidota bacterium]MBK7572327.1 rhomboid family intramembrane serine protease [Bacteroidota bacterium]MBP9789124.1 rhomboid family intramembrane serine protease [Bacteroidia bacterium]MBP9922439.1 rhomboid family intramembrane serine protease [Bacteroidia bacterium]